MFKVATTYKEKKEVILYWETMRKLAESIRDEYDRACENKCTIERSLSKKLDQINITQKNTT